VEGSTHDVTVSTSLNIFDGKLRHHSAIKHCWSVRYLTLFDDKFGSEPSWWRSVCCYRAIRSCIYIEITIPYVRVLRSCACSK